MGKRIKRALSLFLAAVLTITSVELNDVFTVSAFAEDVPADDAAELLICDWLVPGEGGSYVFGKNDDDNYAWFNEQTEFEINKERYFALSYKVVDDSKKIYSDIDISNLHVFSPDEKEIDANITQVASNVEYTFGSDSEDTPDSAINGKYSIFSVKLSDIGNYIFIYDPDGDYGSGDEAELTITSSLPEIGFYTGFGREADKLLENYEFDTSKTNFVYILTKSGFDKNYSIRVNNNGEYINKNDDKFNDYIELVTGVDECIILKESIIGKNLEIVILSEDGEVDGIVQNLRITKAPQSRIYSEGWIKEENGKYSLGYISESNKANFKSTSWTEEYLNNSLYIFRYYDPDTNESTPVDILDTSVVDITMPEGASGFTEVGSLEFEEEEYKVYSLTADKLGDYKVTYKEDGTSVVIKSGLASIRFYSENEENIDNYLTEYEYNKYEQYHQMFIFTDDDIDLSEVKYSLIECDNLGFWKDETSNDLGSYFNVNDNRITFKKAFNGSLIARYSDENRSYERWIDLREKEYSSLQISMDIDYSEEEDNITVKSFRDSVCFNDYIKQPIYGTSFVVFAYYNPQNGTYTPVELKDISVNNPANAPEFVDTNVKIEKDGQKYSVYSIDRSVVGKYEFTYEGTTAVFENTLPGIAAYTGEEATFENIISIAKYNKNKEVNQFYINILDENVNASDLTFVIEDYFNNTSYEGDELKNHIGIEEVNEKQIKVELDNPGNNLYYVSVVDKKLNDDGSANTYFGFCVVPESQLLWADSFDYNVETGEFSFHRSEDGSEYACFYPVSEQVEFGSEITFALLNIDNSNGTTYEPVTKMDGISVKYNDTEDVELEWCNYVDYEFGNQENGKYRIYCIYFNKLGKYTLTYTNSNNVTTSVDIQCVLPEAGFYTSSEKTIENLITDQYSYVENETVYFIYKNDGLLAYDICTEEYANDLFSFNSIRDNVFTFTLKKMPEKSTKDGFEILVKLEYEDGSRRETAIYFKYRENIAAGKVAFGNCYNDGDCAILEKARTSLELKYGVDYCNLFWFGISKGDGTFIPVNILDSANKLTIYYQENASSKKTVANYNEEYGKTPVRVNMEDSYDKFYRYSFHFDETGIYTVELTVNGIKSSVKVTVDESYFESPFIGTIISEEDYNNGQFDLRNAEAKLRTGETMQEVIDKLTADIKSGAKNTGYLYITLNSYDNYFVEKATNVTQTISTENYGIADINGILINIECARDQYDKVNYSIEEIAIDATTSVKIFTVDFYKIKKNFSDGELFVNNVRYYRNDNDIYYEDNGSSGKYKGDDVFDTDIVVLKTGFEFDDTIDFIHNILTDTEKEKLEKSGHNIIISAECTNEGTNLPDKAAQLIKEEMNNEGYVTWNVETAVLELSYSIGSDKKVINSFEKYENVVFNLTSNFSGDNAVLYNYCDGKLEKLETLECLDWASGSVVIKTSTKKLGRFILVYNTQKLNKNDFSRDDTSTGDTYDYGVDYRTDLINIDYQGWGLRFQPEIEGILEYVLFDENSKPVQRDKYGYYPVGSYKVHLINKQVGFDYEVSNYTITITPAFRYYLYYADGREREGSFKATDDTIDVIKKAYYGNGYREEGYTLKGWFTESGEQVTEIDPSNPKFQKVVVLYEKVVPKTYTLTYTEYDDNYHKVNTFTQTLTYGETETIKAPSQAMNNAHKGERFAGWKCALTNFRLISPGEKVKLEYFEGVMNIFSTSNERFGKVEAVLTPVYESNEYTVTYKFDSETVLATGKYAYGKGMTLLKSIPATAPVTSVEGYTFAGWYTEKIGGTKLTSIGKKTYGDVVVYAHWTPKTYTVSFNRNGGTSGSMKDVKYTYDTYGVLPANKFSYPGYSFAGWSTSKDSTEIQYPDSFSVKNLVSSGKITLYAVWIPVSYRLDYDYMTDDNVEGPADLEFEYDKNKGVALAGKDSITREGYIFDGWYKDSKYKTKITSTKGLSKDTIVYAKWKADNYTVYLHSDVSDYIAEPKTISNVKYAKGTALPNNTFTCTDPDGVKYAFVGWSTVPGETEATYKNKGKIPAYVDGLKITEGGKLVLDLYAVWKAEYRINYVLNGGELISLYVTDSYMYGEGINGTDRTLNIPSRDGYTFAGWYNNAKFKGKAITTISATSASDITLYAKWNALKYKVTYNSNAPYGTKVTGSTKAQNSVVYGKSTALTKNGFKIKGYKFVGWSTNSEATKADYTDRQKVTGFGSYSSEITLYAVWTPEVYTITYVINGKKVETDTYTINDDYELMDYIRIGYTFTGWCTDKNCKKKASNFKAGTTGNKTFYGKETMNK